jgi:hypothetical protein
MMSCSYVEISHDKKTFPCLYDDTWIRIGLILKTHKRNAFLKNRFEFVAALNLKNFVCFSSKSRASGGLQCGPPPAPLNAKMVLGGSDQISDDPNQLHVIAASVTYVCDPGFELIG